MTHIPALEIIFTMTSFEPATADEVKISQVRISHVTWTNCLPNCCNSLFQSRILLSCFRNPTLSQTCLEGSVISSHHPQEVLLAQFSLYVHKSGLNPDSFHFIYFTDVLKVSHFTPLLKKPHLSKDDM